MKMSAEGRKRLTQREGVRLKAYKDSVGIWTIGIGHTSMAGPPTVTPGLTITKEECDAIFARDLVKYENAVNNAVKVPLLQNEFDALVSLCYNIGPGGLARSTVIKKLNAGDKQGAANAFMAWVKPPEITGRRLTEKKQFLTPYAGVQITAEPKKDNLTAPAVASAGIGALLWSFWNSVYFWPVVGGVGALIILGTILYHKHKNRTL